jgi:uncharacterized SAM-binding protein YcdF (DUF218 family)
LSVLALEGGAFGIALWCILFSFQLLPGLLADTWGVILFAIAAAVIGVTRLRPVLVGMLIVASGLVLLVTETSLANVVASRWVRDDQSVARPVGAIVVLSAGLNPDSTVSSEALDNLIYGLRLVRSGRSTILVTTTVQEKFPGGMVSSVTDQARMIGLFGNGVKWMRTAPTESTHDEALRSADLLLRLGIRSIVLVTAPMQSRRACSAFEAVGFVVICAPAESRSAGGTAPGPWPADRLRVFGDWIYEVLATWKYQTAGWLNPRGTFRPGPVATAQHTPRPAVGT